MSKPETLEALLRPSASHRWLECTASPATELTYPSGGTSDFANEGIDAHSFAADALTEVLKLPEVPAGNDLIKWMTDTFAGRELPLGHVVDEDMIDAIATYMEPILFEQQGQVYVELPLAISVIPPDGTSDCAVVDLDNRRLWVNDLKYGKGVIVDATDNPQLKLYAIGVLEALDFLDAWETIDEVILAIHQPRINAATEWKTTTAELRDWGENWVKPTVQMILAGEGEFKPGEGCRFCRAKGDCKARAAWVADKTGAEFEDLTEDDPPLTFNVDPAKLSPAELGAVLKNVAYIKSWCNDIEGAVINALTASVEVPGWKLVAGRSNRAWKDEAAAEKTLKGLRLKVDQYAPRKLVTVAQAEKLVGKDRYAEKLVGLVEKPPPKPTLAPASDKRPAIVVAEQFEDETQSGEE